MFCKDERVKRKDFLEKKRIESVKLSGKFTSAIAIMEKTLQRLGEISQAQLLAIGEIDDYQKSLSETRASMVKDNERVNKVAQNFAALLGEDADE